MINLFQKKMNKKGFTLVELIIVIAVMAILAAIVIPRMGGITGTFRTNADEREAATYARELEVQIQAGNTPSPTSGNIANASVPQSRKNSGAAADLVYKYLILGNIVHVYVDSDATADITTDAAINAFSGVKVEVDSGGAID